MLVTLAIIMSTIALIVSTVSLIKVSKKIDYKGIVKELKEYQIK